MQYESLSAPVTIGEIVVPNRIVMPPMVIWKSGQDGRVGTEHREHYRSAVGPGLVIVEATAVSPEGRLAASQLGLWEDAQADGLAGIAEIIHANGAVPGIQLHHAGARTDRERTWGLEPVAPSVLPDREGEVRELTEEEIFRIIADFALAARRAVAAGFRYLEIHGAHGYLGSQFLSPETNRRSDRWGGSPAGRLRFLREVYRAVRSEVADGALIGCRLGAAGAGPFTLSLESGIEAARGLEREGIDLLHVSHSGTLPPPLENEVSSSRPPLSDLVRIAGRVRAEVSVPVIAVGSVRRPEEAERAVAEEFADLVAVGRGILADPRWAEKTLSGRAGDIYLCSECPSCLHRTDASRCPARMRAGSRG